MFQQPFDREKLYAELHSRPSPLVDDGALLVHYAVLHEGNSCAEFSHLSVLFDEFSETPTLAGHCIYRQFGSFELRFERHQEFSSYTIIGAEHVLQSLPQLWRWLAEIPGRHLIQTECACLIEKSPAMATTYFAEQRLCASRVAGDAAEVYTSFGLMNNGVSRYVIVNRSLNPYQLGRLAQRLLEIETYRLLALLTLPLARTLLAKVRRFDESVAQINRRLTIGAAPNLPQVLDRLVAIAAQLHNMAAHAHYRIEASNAYYQIVLQRLCQLREVPIAEHQSLTEFLERRLAPSVATCKTAGRRLNSVMARVSQTADLVAAKLSVQMTTQNQNLLAAMNQRGKVQLHVQLALESLSVAAIAYYGLGLLSYLFAPLPFLRKPEVMQLALAVSVPVVVFGIWWSARRLQRRLLQVSEQNIHHID